MKTYRNKPESETQRWWKDLILRVGKAMADENVLDGDREILLEVVEPDYAEHTTRGWAGVDSAR